MNRKQIETLRAAEKRPDPKRDWWHYRFLAATERRDAVWQFLDRDATDWEDVPSPDDETLARLEPRGYRTINGFRWRGFHDPAEYRAGR